MNDSPGAPARMRWRWLDWPARARRTVTTGYLALITALLFAPGSTFEDIDRWLPHQDKVVHVAIFLGLAALVRWSIPGERGDRWPRLAALAAVMLYAASVEALQPQLTTGRLFELSDLASNCLGTLAGWWSFGALPVARPPAREPIPR